MQQYGTVVYATDKTKNVIQFNVDFLPTQWTLSSNEDDHCEGFGWVGSMGGVININEQALKRADAKIMDALSTHGLYATKVLQHRVILWQHCTAVLH